MNERTSPVDGKRYAIGFEMRLPQAWNGRFFYQANGGVDGSVVTATGADQRRAGPQQRAGTRLRRHQLRRRSQRRAERLFGIDPEARLDYGYRAVAALTPMAKEVIRIAYGKAPDRSYIGGCSNGGRHTLVAAARLADEYDGFLVGDPGTVLPRAAIANLVGGKTYASLATDPADLSTGFTLAERQLVSSAVLARCDALDGAADGMVQDTKACQAAFDLERDVPTCRGARDGSCLSAAQKSGIGQLFAGVKTRDRHARLRQLSVRRGPGHERLGELEIQPRRRPATPAPSPTSCRCRRSPRPASTAARSCSRPTSTTCSPRCRRATRPTPSRRCGS